MFLLKLALLQLFHTVLFKTLTIKALNLYEYSLSCFIKENFYNQDHLDKKIGKTIINEQEGLSVEGQLYA